jgi:hypothetical protein
MKEPPEKKSARESKPCALLREGKTLEEIAAIRERQLGTIVQIVADLVQGGEINFQPAWRKQEICADRMGLWSARHGTVVSAQGSFAAGHNFS